MNNSVFGFKDGDLETIIEALSNFKDIEKASIFGSRAKGSYRAGSDVDLAVWSTGSKQVGELSGILNDIILLPYKFDVLDYYNISNHELKEHIDRAGIKIYSRD